MSHIQTPKPHGEKAKTLNDFLRIHTEWQAQHESAGGDDGFLSQLWYRGVKEQFPNQVPGVYRPHFTQRANRLKKTGDEEDKRLHLEREMVAQFRIAGASFLNRES